MAEIFRGADFGSTTFRRMTGFALYRENEWFVLNKQGGTADTL